MQPSRMSVLPWPRAWQQSPAAVSYTHLVDINVGVVESLKQGGSHARMINHTRSHHGNLGNMAVGLQMAKANGLLMLLQEHGSRLQVGLGNGKAYVLALLMADSL